MRMELVDYENVGEMAGYTRCLRVGNFADVRKELALAVRLPEGLIRICDI